MNARSILRRTLAPTLLLSAVALMAGAPSRLMAQGNSVPLHYRNLTVMVVETYGNNNTRPLRGAQVEIAPENGATDPHVEFPLRSSTNAPVGQARFTRIPPSRLVGAYRITVTYPNGCGEETQSVRTGSTTDRRVTFNVNCAQRRRTAASSRGTSNGGGSDSGGTSGNGAVGDNQDGATSSSEGDYAVLAVRDVRLNRNGQVQADVVWTDGPKPSRSLARVTVAWGDGSSATREALRAVVQAPDRPFTVTTRAVVPCDATTTVSAHAEAWFSDGAASGSSETSLVELTRTCASRRDGTPNPVVENLEQINPGRLQ